MPTSSHVTARRSARFAVLVATYAVLMAGRVSADGGYCPRGVIVLTRESVTRLDSGGCGDDATEAAKWVPTLSIDRDDIRDGGGDLAEFALALPTTGPMTFLYDAAVDAVPPPCVTGSSSAIGRPRDGGTIFGVLIGCASGSSPACAEHPVNAEATRWHVTEVSDPALLGSEVTIFGELGIVVVYVRDGVTYRVEYQSS